MRIIKELKKIAGLNDRIGHLAKMLDHKIDTDGLILQSAHLISGCRERNGHLYQDGERLDNSGLVDDTYYCDQSTGYCEDHYYGMLYYKTDVPGQFVAVPFDM